MGKAKILVTGAGGQLGKCLRDAFKSRGIEEVDYTDFDELDITSPEATEAYISKGDYRYIINCAAFTDVEKAETEKHSCEAVNSTGISNIAASAEKRGIRIIHISTDYVFDGNSSTAYTEGSRPNPLSVYGVTKRRGETSLLALSPDSIILRTGWLYSAYGKNFVKTMLALKDRDKVEVVDDQIGTPTYAPDLAEAILAVLTAKTWLPGIYHFSNEGVASWYDVACEIFRILPDGMHRPAVIPAKSSDVPRLAARPTFSVMDKSKFKTAYNRAIPHWRDSLEICVRQLTEA